MCPCGRQRAQLHAKLAVIVPPHGDQVQDRVRGLLSVGPIEARPIVSSTKVNHLVSLLPSQTLTPQGLFNPVMPYSKGVHADGSPSRSKNHRHLQLSTAAKCALAISISTSVITHYECRRVWQKARCPPCKTLVWRRQLPLQRDDPDTQGCHTHRSP